MRALHSGNSKRFRPRRFEKRASIRWEPAEYRLEWGQQVFKGPHVVIDDPGGRYGVNMRIFFDTHEACPDKEGCYVKTASVRAAQVTKTTPLVTRLQSRIEGIARLEAGGWIVQNPEGELYYNTADEFAKRYEPEPEAPVVRAPAVERTRDEHLKGKGPKRILALDGGGIRGRLTLGILKGIENALGGPLSNHFDLIGGTSTGSIIATGLALGWRVEALIELYDQLGATVFEGNFFRNGLLVPKFPAAPLETALQAKFGDRLLGGPELKTGLAIMAKRLDTNSPWPIHNHPDGPYYDAPQGASWVPNKDFLLRRLVRASAAAPTFFAPETFEVALGVKGAFVDGGVSPHNNPSLQLVLLATLHGYGFRWPLGVDKLQVVSVGTGHWRAKHDPDWIVGQAAAANGLLSLKSLMDDCSALNQLVMQWLSDSPLASEIDSEIGTLSFDLLGGADPMLSYLRYNVPLELDWLLEKFPELHFDQPTVDALREMDNPRSLELLGKLGEAAGREVKVEHLLNWPGAGAVAT
jgi:hypothetical protein